MKPAMRRKASLLPLVLIFLYALAPILGAVLVYHNPQWWPQDASNYGSLVQPQRPLPSGRELQLTTLDGKAFDPASLKGQWLLISADHGECLQACARKLFVARNAHASQGKNVDRVTRVWFVTDEADIPQKVLDAYQGTLMLRARADQLARFLPPDTAGGILGPIWVVDPLGNLMLQFPADADGVKVRKDLSRLLYNSRIG
ncbi:membrane protein [Bordetella holmesii F627]|nr:membrane protein [Bordetella holmesii F627]KCV07914.1 hypothetical protein L498_2980 [Bordetella holmesii CDC-H629-BH]